MLNNKKIIIILAIAVLFIASAVVYWHPLPSYPHITQPTPSVSLPSPFIPAITSSPAPEVSSMDTRSWGERFRDKTIPEVPGVTWQTYTNKEYGFAMEYPKRGSVKIVANAGVTVFDFASQQYESEKIDSTVLILSTSQGTLRDELMQQGNYWSERIKKDGLTPDIIIHGIDLFLYDPNGRSDQNVLWIRFEKYGYIYRFGEPFEAHNEENNKIIEHMIKTFRFLK